MLKITVEIFPFGMESIKRVIGEATIVNLDTNKYEGLANYNLEFYEKDTGKLYKKKYIHNFQRDKGFWELIKKGLDE